VRPLKLQIGHTATSGEENERHPSVAEHKSYKLLVLDGELAPAEIGTAVIRVANCNDFDSPLVSLLALAAVGAVL
jgi:hypothetical protein